jgi:murein DD-endopeptidase MepM/ murein hydrolase activator NlpD
MHPVPGRPCTCAYGTRGAWWNGGKHRGVDWGAPVGTPVLAPWSGRVIGIGTWGPAYGRFAPVIDFDPLPNGMAGLWGVLGHLGACSVTVGQRVAAGQVIGAVGMEGLSHGPHLHFEIQARPRWTPAVLHLARNPAAWVAAQPPAGIAHNE